MAIDKQLPIDHVYRNYIDRIQNTVGNFIRTGDPNDWEGNQRPFQEIGIISNWKESNLFTIFGEDSAIPANYRHEFCDKLDKMNEYMLH